MCIQQTQLGKFTAIAAPEIRRDEYGVIDIDFYLKRARQLRSEAAVGIFGRLLKRMNRFSRWEKATGRQV